MSFVNPDSDDPIGRDIDPRGPITMAERLRAARWLTLYLGATFGVVFAVASFFGIYQDALLRQHLASHGARATATIVALHPQSHGGMDYDYRFTLPDGVAVGGNYSMMTAEELDTSPQVGAPVPLLYDPADPDRAVLAPLGHIVLRDVPGIWLNWLLMTLAIAAFGALLGALNPRPRRRR